MGEQPTGFLDVRSGDCGTAGSLGLWGEVEKDELEGFEMIHRRRDEEQQRVGGEGERCVISTSNAKLV
jgi:hypothetical protein